MKVRTSRFITGCLLLLAILGAAMTPAHAYDPQTTCQITLWFDTNFENPSNLSGGAGNPPPGSKIVGTGAAAVPRFSGSVGVGLSKYVMRVDDMNPLDSDWTNYDNNVSSIQFEHVENGVYVPGCDSWTAILYDDSDLVGESISLTGSQTHLSTIGWNDRASSIVVVGPAFDYDGSPPDGCTVELYDANFSGNTWGTSSHVNPYADIYRHTYSSEHGAGKISTIRFGGECGTTRVKLQNGPTDFIEFTNADGPTYNLSEFGWNDRADYWTVNFDVAPDPSPRGCILRVFSDDEYTGQSWAIAGSQTTGTINANQGAGVISSLAFEGECGNSEVILADGSGNSAYVRAADGAQHPLWLSDWNNRAQSLTANFVSGPPVPTNPDLPAPIYVPCEVRLFDGLYSGSRWSANTEQTTTGVFSSSQGGGLVSSVEFVGAWCNDTFLELYDVHPNQDADAVPYVIKVADGARRNLGTYGFDNKTQFWRVNFSEDPPAPSRVPNVVGLDYTQAEVVLSRMFYRPVADLNEDLVMGRDIQGDMTDRTVHNKVL
ncbi:MAG: hypothetical protein HOE54_09120, partial [Gammaproteobacteria bacterium]|nr:hypothetical protein [Gammaproteobacteria bacterium]